MSAVMNDRQCFCFLKTSDTSENISKKYDLIIQSIYIIYTGFVSAA